MPLSQNGYPVLTSSSKNLHSWVIPGADTTLKLRNGSAGFLLAHLATVFDDSIEELHEPLLDDWGYAYRPVRGYADWSNHASGTAIDLNATDHPLGKRETFSDADEARIRRVLRKYSGAIRWGGDYRTRADEMHFEINVPLSQCEQIAKKLIGTKRGEAVLEANKGQREVIYS